MQGLFQETYSESPIQLQGGFLAKLYKCVCVCVCVCVYVCVCVCGVRGPLVSSSAVYTLCFAFVNIYTQKVQCGGDYVSS